MELVLWRLGGGDSFVVLVCATAITQRSAFTLHGFAMQTTNAVKQNVNTSCWQKP